jgi:hypothetical protein
VQSRWGHALKEGRRGQLRENNPASQWFIYLVTKTIKLSSFITSKNYFNSYLFNSFNSKNKPRFKILDP